MARRRRRRKRGSKITVRHADGTVEVVKANHFRKKKRKSPRQAYREYLRSDHWQQLRAEVLQRDGYVCVRCGCDDGLQVHHRTYERRGHEALTDLVTVCKECHRAHHRGEFDLGLAVDPAREELDSFIDGVLDGFAAEARNA